MTLDVAVGVGVGVGVAVVEEVEVVGVDDDGVVVGVAVLVGGTFVGVVVVAGLVVADRVGLPADVGTVPTLVLVAGLVPGVGPTEAVAGLTAWLTDPDGPLVLLVRFGGAPPPLSRRASTAAVTPQTATPAPPAMTRRRVNGEARLRCVLDSSSS